jgi:DNA-binding NtrC family response regulator
MEQVQLDLARFLEQQAARWGFDYLPARSEIMRRVLHQVKLAVATDEPVTIIGEAGTGKQALAKIIHYQRHGTTGNFARLDCEILSHQVQRQQLLGRLDLPDLNSPQARGLLHADGQGTLCIGAPMRLASDLQAEAVSALDRQSTRWRIIATERAPLEDGRADGRLTESFYCFLTRLVIALPPLRERLPELRDYVQIILGNCAQKFRREALTLEPTVMELFLAYDWPGNLRELEAVLEEMTVQVKGDIITADDLPRRFHRANRRESTTTDPLPKPPPLDALLEEVEKRMLRVALEQNRGNKSKAAEFLGISRARFHRRAEQLGLVPSETPETTLSPPNSRRKTAKPVSRRSDDVKTRDSGEKGN